MPVKNQHQCMPALEDDRAKSKERNSRASKVSFGASDIIQDYFLLAIERRKAT
jgi:hypothetical protein